jgi:phosphate transport system protein
MAVHLLRELGKLKRLNLSVGARVEEAIAKAVTSLSSRAPGLANEVIDQDGEIDRLEVEVEEECLKLLALYQPVATDMRFIVAVLKMNNDLERMGDLAVNVAKSAKRVISEPPITSPQVFTPMAAKVRSMVKQSLDALVNADAALAQQVCAADDEVDAMRKDLREQIESRLATGGDETAALVSLYTIVGHLERLADMATNVAEDVIYMVQGKIVRHRAAAPQA